jgi:hypothetical protein
MRSGPYIEIKDDELTSKRIEELKSRLEVIVYQIDTIDNLLLEVKEKEEFIIFISNLIVNASLSI